MAEEPRYIAYAKKTARSKKEGEAIRLAAKRFLKDLRRRDLEFRADRVTRCLEFISVLKHFKGRSAGAQFILEPWQEFIVANIVGFYWRRSGDRRFTASYIEVSRKNGKTALAAALCMYFLIWDGEMGAEVDLAANSKDQAKIAFEFCEQFAGQLDKQQQDLKVYRDYIDFKSTVSRLNVFAADDSKLDGFNASFALLDEYHAAKNTRMRDVLKSSMGQRANPHLCTITTAGFDKTGPCYQLRDTCLAVLHGAKKDDSLFAAIYSMDDNDDWTQEKNWRKCTPNLDVTVTTKYLREQVTSAMNNPSEEVGVRTKNLNQWCDTVDVWIPDVYILRCTRRVEVSDFRDCLCWVGVDLAAVSDMTAVTCLFRREDDPKYYFKTWYYLPESCLSENSNKDLYRFWRQQGLLTITPGNVTDYDYITNDLMRVSNVCAIQRVGYDSYNSTQWAISATDLGLPLMPYSQSIGNFNKPTREFERLILSGLAVIDNNEITRWMFKNVALKYDYNGNCLAIDTIVPTPTGFRRIDEIKVGDYVFGADGKPTRVISVTDVNYNRDCYKLKFHNGAEVIADYSHEWLVNYYSITKDRRAFVTVGKKSTKWIFDHFINGQGRRWLHTFYCAPVEYDEKELPIDPYTLGQWLGDGSKSASSFTCADYDLCMYGHLEGKYGVRYIKDRRGKTYTVSVSGGLRSELKAAGLLGNKHIPPIYFEGSINQRLALVQGLMDTDGTCNRRNAQCSFVNKDKVLCMGLHRLLNSLGIRNTLSSRNLREYGTAYSVQFYSDLPVFRLERKRELQEKWVRHKKSCHNLIESIEKVGSVPTKCITVANPDNLFLITEDYVVTGNCKPNKGLGSQKKIDGVISQIQAVGTYQDMPMHESGGAITIF